MTVNEAYLTRITLYPVKSLDGKQLSNANIDLRSGSLAGDREFAMVDHNDRFVNGKRTATVHQLEASFTGDKLTLTRPGRPTTSFELREDNSQLTAWLSDYFGYEVGVKRNRHGGFPDDTTARGPTVISTATIRTVAGWFPGLDADSIRRRFRANLEIAGVPPFWEDRLFANEGKVVRFTIGDVTFEGVNPCARCVVPTRDPATGEPYEGFRETFIKGRRESRPPWVASDRYDHEYRLMVNTRIPEASPGDGIRTGDPFTRIGKFPE